MVKRDGPPELNVVNLDIGDRVRCDLCGVEYTGRPDSGGIYIGGQAICPVCAPRAEEVVRKHGKEHLIEARCPVRKPFARWVLEDLRG